jgi:hypothetical protein
MAWSDYFKLFTFGFQKDPSSKVQDTKNLTGAGIAQADALQTFAGDDVVNNPGGLMAYRQTNDMIDITTLTNRTARYKEYERLRNLPEIETVVTVISDEACVSGNTEISTPFGLKKIEDLVNNSPDDRFLVYCYDEISKDYTLGWAYNPRLVKKEKTTTIILDDGSKFTATSDHKVLNRNGKWVETGSLKEGDTLMAFYRLPVNNYQTKLNKNQFPRVFTYNKGWTHERMFVDEWRTGKVEEENKKTSKILHMLSKGLALNKTCELIGMTVPGVIANLKRIGFTTTEVHRLSKKQDRRRVIGVFKNETEENVYDISVEKHKCFCTDSVVLHNCQKDTEGNICKIQTSNEEVRKELEFLFFHRQMLNINKNGWSWFKNLCVNGDHFIELIIDPDNPEDGLYKSMSLPAETMYRIETIRGKLIEFQQSKEGPDYTALMNPIPLGQDNFDLQKSTAIRFNFNQIVHFRIGEDRKLFYPYGVSLIEPARSPAHQLRLMEDAMVTYRLARAPERRVFYVDVGQLPPFKVDSLIDRMKDQFRKRKVAMGSGSGVNQVDERWQPPAVDEDYWLPLRPGSNTRIETLPGAQNLGEVDDALYFRNKLFVSLNFPKSYFSGEDVNATRMTLSAQDVKFARMIERLQSSYEDGLYDIADRHLYLRGFPQELYRDLKIKMTPPSDWRELSRAEVVNSRLNVATQLKTANLMSDYDIYTQWLQYNEQDTTEMLSRLKIQKLEELKIQVLSQNPQLIGVGIPQENKDEAELSAVPGGPAQNLEAPPEEGQEGQDPNPNPTGEEENAETPPEENTNNAKPLPEPDKQDVEKYGLEIKNYETEMDNESPDYSIDG